MPKIKSKSRADNSTDTYEARLVAAKRLRKGDRVVHRLTGEQGSFQQINLGFALPEVWVDFDSDRETSKIRSCNPLDLEVIDGANQPLVLLDCPISNPCCDALSSNIEVLVEDGLTEEEALERHRLELKVERAFYEAGAALRELRDKRLYRSTHKTFEEYCQERFGYHRRHSYQLINAASVVENLCANGAQKSSEMNIAQILPTSERQVRPLTQLEPVEQREIWYKAVELADGKVPSSRIVKSIVEKLKAKPLVQGDEFCKIGDVFTLSRLEGAERKYNSCWAIAKSINDFTITVEVHDATILVKPENLQPLEELDARRQLPQTLKRIRRLRDIGLLDRAAYTMLESLGRQTYLTDLEDKFLSFMEEYYKINSDNT
ncbi:hypothetical protein [Gloeocapsopsis dulcis]|uniref:hypothetical protein n=1 Tax=Gloeocapsopsis dulcis TaxID=2859516 RepID=UPI000CF6DA91|nr:hypothetical protein [Gloeocapsopsis dulcis]WNN92104.1 hypothetical protein P0S91_26285 [Gloeocapsopsis dulcis]